MASLRSGEKETLEKATGLVCFWIPADQEGKPELKEGNNEPIVYFGPRGNKELSKPSSLKEALEELRKEKPTESYKPDCTDLIWVAPDGKAYFGQPGDVSKSVRFLEHTGEKEEDSILICLASQLTHKPKSEEPF